MLSDQSVVGTASHRSGIGLFREVVEMYRARLHISLVARWYLAEKLRELEKEKWTFRTLVGSFLIPYLKGTRLSDYC